MTRWAVRERHITHLGRPVWDVTAVPSGHIAPLGVHHHPERAHAHAARLTAHAHAAATRAAATRAAERARIRARIAACTDPTHTHTQGR